MMHLKRFQFVRTLYRASSSSSSSSYLLGSSCRSYSSALSNGSERSFRSFYPHLYNGYNEFSLASVKALTLRSTMAAELSLFMNDKRLLSTQVKSAPPHARPVGQQIALTSPGFVYEPYKPREKIPLWKRLFTRTGWRRTKEDMILEVMMLITYVSGCINYFRSLEPMYRKQKFYNEVANIYKELNTLIANGDKKTLRKVVTENMFSALKNEIKQRESVWSKVYWEMVQPVVSIRTLRARLIGVDRKDHDKVFIQLTLEIMAKQKFEAYDSKGAVVAGDKNKEVLVCDIWVFEKSLFHKGSYWRVCGRLSTKAS
ncbi:uncharacterized protein LOC107465460 [Arachis duranensis]|uniref:Large ribosomal subunit protein mL45 n=1 Tax=Arachis duranensis TaxID=130453 RepID=A0A9C6WQ46_ARADU|nr:uncharacterized protein LOC107465460 [Arachis duranensis]